MRISSRHWIKASGLKPWVQLVILATDYQLKQETITSLYKKRDKKHQQQLTPDADIDKTVKKFKQLDGSSCHLNCLKNEILKSKWEDLGWMRNSHPQALFNMTSESERTNKSKKQGTVWKQANGKQRYKKSYSHLSVLCGAWCYRCDREFLFSLMILVSLYCSVVWQGVSI